MSINPIPGRTTAPISTSGSYPLVGYVPWEARTNLCLQSQTFGTTWTKVNAGDTLVENNAIGLSGALTADTLTLAAGTAQKGLVQSVVVAVGAASLTFYMGAGTHRYVQILTNQASDGYANFDTLTGAFSVSAYRGETTPLPSGGYACTYAFTCVGATAIYCIAVDSLAATRYSTTASTGTMIFKACQCELGSFATPYQPTTTVAVARNADVLTYTGADVANIKTLACTFSRGVGVSNLAGIVTHGDGTGNNYADIRASSATSITMNGVTGGVIQWQTVMSNPYVPGTTSKAAWSIATNDIKMDKDGVAQTPDTVATPPTRTVIEVGLLAGANILNGPVNHIYGWTRNLSQSELGAVDA